MTNEYYQGHSHTWGQGRSAAGLQQRFLLSLQVLQYLPLLINFAGGWVGERIHITLPSRNFSTHTGTDK